MTGTETLTIGIVGFGNFGQFLAKRYASRGHRVIGTSRRDYSAIAKELGCEYVTSNDALMDNSPQVVVFCTSIVSLHTVLSHFPLHRLDNCIVVDVLSVKLYPRELLLRMLPESANVLCTHPMFGPVSGAKSWEGLPFMFDDVRVDEAHKAVRDAYVGIYDGEGCRMVEMSCAQHDSDAASSQFLTHMTGRILDDMHVHSTEINTSGFDSLLGIMDSTAKDSFDLFYGLYKYNPIARSELHKLEHSLRHIRESLEQAERDEETRALENATDKDSVKDGVNCQVLNSLKRTYVDGNDLRRKQSTQQPHIEPFVSAVAMSFISRMKRGAKARQAESATPRDDDAEY